MKIACENRALTIVQVKGEPMKHITLIGLALTLSTALLASTAVAQTTAPAQGQSSLGDYARKIRKDPGTAKAKPKVFDNDNLPTEDKLSVIGEKSADNAGAPGDDKSAAGGNANDDMAKNAGISIRRDPAGPWGCQSGDRPFCGRRAGPGPDDFGGRPGASS